MIETILFILLIVLVFMTVISELTSAINSIPTYKYELLGTFIQNYNYLWDKGDSYRTKIVAIFEDKENNSRKYEGSLIQAHEWLRSWERHDITTEQLINFLKDYGVKFKKCNK